MRDRVVTVPAAALPELKCVQFSAPTLAVLLPPAATNRILSSAVCPIISMTTLQKCLKCEAHLNELKRRREEEANTIRSLDRKWVNKGEMWYLISTSWLERWKYFLDERHAGLVEPPGPVSNTGA